MATIKKSRKLRNGKASVAPWARQYLMDRIPPGKDEEGYDDWLGWYFFSDPKPGMPPDWRELPPRG